MARGIILQQCLSKVMKFKQILASNKITMINLDNIVWLYCRGCLKRFRESNVTFQIEKWKSLIKDVSSQILVDSILFNYDDV